MNFWSHKKKFAERQTYIEQLSAAASVARWSGLCIILWREVSSIKTRSFSCSFFRHSYSLRSISGITGCCQHSAHSQEMARTLVAKNHKFATKVTWPCLNQWHCRPSLVQPMRRQEKTTHAKLDWKKKKTSLLLFCRGSLHHHFQPTPERVCECVA